MAASHRLARRYVLAGITVVTVVHAVPPLRTLELAAVEFVLAYILLKLVPELITKDYGRGAVATYFLAVFKAVDVALLA